MAPFACGGVRTNVDQKRTCSADTAVRGADSADCGGYSADTAVPTYTHMTKKNRPCCPKTTRPALFAWQRPTLPGPCGPSTIGAGGLNGRVRDGNAWFPSAIATKRQRFRCYRSLNCFRKARQLSVSLLHAENRMRMIH